MINLNRVNISANPIDGIEESVTHSSVTHMLAAGVETKPSWMHYFPNLLYLNGTPLLAEFPELPPSGFFSISLA